MLSFGDLATIRSKVKGLRIRHVPISETEQRKIRAQMSLSKYWIDGLIKSYSLVRADRFAY